MDQTATFEITLLLAEDDRLIEFGALTLGEGTVAYGAIYSETGKMLCIRAIQPQEGQAKMVVPAALYEEMSIAKLFVLDGKTMILVSDGVVLEK